MNDKRRVQVSKFISRHLRHAPAEIGLVLEPGGWVMVEDLLTGATETGFPFTREELLEVVAACEKPRFSLDSTSSKIRANQGHSAVVDLQFDPTPPPPVLYHGTPERNREVILRDGLRKMARHHVHLSADTKTAETVGRRRGKPILFEIDAARMAADGHSFFLSANGVWLVDLVPPEYLRLV